MADNYAELELSCIHAYPSVFSRVRRHPGRSVIDNDSNVDEDLGATDSEQAADNEPKDYVTNPPTMNEHNRWIPVILNAPYVNLVMSLAKLIYEDEPTRLTPPEHVNVLVYLLTLHGKSITDPRKQRNQDQSRLHLRLHLRKDVIASMSYRWDRSAPVTPTLLIFCLPPWASDTSILNSGCSRKLEPQRNTWFY